MIISAVLMMMDAVKHCKRQQLLVLAVRVQDIVIEMTMLPEVPLTVSVVQLSSQMSSNSLIHLTSCDCL